MEIAFVPRYKEVFIVKDYYEYNLPKETQIVTITFEILPSLPLRPSQFIITTFPVYHCNLPRLSLRPSQYTLRPSQFIIATFPVYHCNLPSLSLQPSQFIIATSLVVLQDCINYSVKSLNLPT